MTRLDPASAPSQNPIDYASRLAEVQARWDANAKVRRELSDERIRLVWEARDEGGMSLGMIARAMGKPAGRKGTSEVSKLLACGYPEPN